MNTDIEARLRAELSADAQRSPEPPERWEQSRPERAPGAFGARRVLLGAACLVAVVAGGAFAIDLQRDPVERMATAPSVAPTVVDEPEPAPTAVSSPSTDPVPVEEAVSSSIGPLAMGGFVMLDAAESLIDAGFVVDAASERTLVELVAVVEQRSAAGELGSLIVLDPTVLDPVPFDDGVLANLAAVLDDVDRVVIVTSNNTSTVTAANNDKLRVLGESRDNVSVLDWSVAVSECRCTYGDGVRLRDEGRVLYARLLEDLIDPQAEPSTIRTNLEDIRTQLPPVTAPQETIIDATEVFGPAGEGRVVKVFGAPDSVCVAATYRDGGAASACSPESTEGLLWLWMGSGESIATEHVVAVHHSDVSVRIAGCDVRTVIPDDLGLAVSSCTPGDAEFLDVEFVAPDATYSVTTRNLSAGPGLPDLEAADLFDATVDDWIIAGTVPAGYEIEVNAEAASNRQISWIQPESGNRITVTQLLFAPGSAPNDPGDVSYEAEEDGTSVSITGVDTSIEVYTTGLDPDEISEFVDELRIGRRDEVPGRILTAREPLFGGDLVFLDSRRGQVATVTAQARDDGWCLDIAPGGGVCPQQLSDGLPITGHGGGYSYYQEGSTTVMAGTAGLAINEVAVIEVQFVDGTIVEVRPTDLTGGSGIKFWNIAVMLELDAPLDIDYQTGFVDTITAYDNTGQPLAQDTGNGPAPVDQ